jgi:hypothetical protein
MDFQPSRLIDRLEAFPALLDTIAADTRPGEWTARPPGGAWAMIEVLGHLLREEREDFRTRLRLTLESPGEPWPGIDPEGDVAKHRDIDLDPADTLAAFRRERADSTAWLRSLNDSDWDASYEHPTIGPLRAGDLLAAWADHDTLHARQLIKRRHEQTLLNAGPYTCRYAGEWTA